MLWRDDFLNYLFIFKILKFVLFLKKGTLLNFFLIKSSILRGILKNLLQIKGGFATLEFSSI